MEGGRFVVGGLTAFLKCVFWIGGGTETVSYHGMCPR